MEKKTSVAMWISLVSNVFLTGIKIAVGLFFRSQVLIADGVHNAGDVIASAVALGSTKVSKKPADEEHPYGHGKAEVIASGFVAVILAIAAVLMAYHSFLSFFRPAVQASGIALIAAVVSFGWKQALYIYCIRLGRQHKSKSLMATAYDHLADVYASLAAAAGIGAALIGERLQIGFLEYGDPIAGILVSFFVMKLAYEIGRDAIDILMEKAVPPDTLHTFEQLVKTIPEVKRIDRIRAREHGHYIIADVRVGIPADYTIKEGHDISRRIKSTIMENYEDVEEVMVHLNPWYQENELR